MTWDKENYIIKESKEKFHEKIPRFCAWFGVFFKHHGSIWRAGGHHGGGGRFLSNFGDNSSINTDNSMAYKSAFDPENDPVVYTTDYGLEIRYSNALTNAALSGYTYFSVGGYNWVIIGYDPSMQECVQDKSGEAFRDNPIKGGDFLTQFETVDKSAAGSAIIRDNFAISTEAEVDDEIGEGCVLCFAETIIGTSTVQFNTSTSKGNNYKGSNLQNHIDKVIYGGTSELSKALQKLPIAPQTLKTHYYGGNISRIENAHLFPLAMKSSSENFMIQSYFKTSEQLYLPDNDTRWWTRSGYSGYNTHVFYVHQGVYQPTPENTGASNVAETDVYVRPAFVLQL